MPRFLTLVSADENNATKLLEKDSIKAEKVAADVKVAEESAVVVAECNNSCVGVGGEGSRGGGCMYMFVIVV